MIGILWVVFFVALTGARPGQGLPLRSTPQAYPHDTNGESLVDAWGSSGLYAAVPALALVVTAVGFLLGCTWCYRHKDCKPNEGAENQLFSASATQLHDARRPPDSGFSEPANNNISEDNNNGPISLREMQNIANNNAAAYIISENEERNRVSRESVVEFEPLPSAIRVADPLEHCADWFAGEEFPRSRLQYLREIGRGWFGRVVEGEIENEGVTSAVAVKILNQNASVEDKARFLDEARVYRDVRHENILAFVAKCLSEEPWILMFELCSMDLQQYLIANRPKMSTLNLSGVPLQLMCDVATALAYLHSRGYLYGAVSSSSALVREAEGRSPRAVLGGYAGAGAGAAPRDFSAPETRQRQPLHTSASEVWSLGTLLWEVCEWGAPAPPQQPPPPALPTPYRNHLYQVMQLCWNPAAELRPTAAQVQALLNHLYTHDAPQDDETNHGDFEERWQTLKPNSIPKLDEHVALVHAPSTSMVSHFTGSEEFNPPTTQDTLSVDMDTAVSRSSSIMSDKDPLSVQIKSESLTNLHGSFEDVRNIYLTHNETALLECHQGNISFEDGRDNQDRSDSLVDPWVKDLLAGSQDDVSYYKDVSDVIKNLDNILNSEKTSSSESSHQASPSRDNLSLDCKKEYPVQSSMVKSPGITNFKNILEMGFDTKEEACDDEEVDKETVGTLSHSFERHSDSTSQHTLENLTPDTPLKDLDFVSELGSRIEEVCEVGEVNEPIEDYDVLKSLEDTNEASYAVVESLQKTELPKEINNSDSKLPKLKDLCVVSLTSVSENEQLIREDCVTSCDSNLNEIRTQVKPKSVDNTVQNDQQVFEEASKQDPVVIMKCVQENKPEIMFLPRNVDTESNHVKINGGQNYSVQMPKDIVNGEETHAEEKTDVLNNIGKEVLPIAIIDIATNIVENEVLHPAIVIVSKMAEERDAKPVLHEEIAESVDVRERNAEHVIEPSQDHSIDKVNEVLTPDDDSIRHVTHTLIEEERKVATEPMMLNEIVHELKIEESTSIENQDAPTKPEPVQNLAVNFNVTQNATEKSESFETEILPPEVQTTPNIKEIRNGEQVFDEAINAECVVTELKDSKDCTRSDNIANNKANDSTAYMDLINYTNSANVNSEILQDDVRDVINSCLENTDLEKACSLIKNESTVYLDLPSLVKEAQDFLNSERVFSQGDDKISASTPKGSECSNITLEGSVKEDLSETKIPAETTEPMKSEQRNIQELLSPFESPSKSHPTDTYDENSSVVLGPFENCTMEFKGVKEIEIPKEELLAFSSNFSEMNLETPSPLRDGNFLNEVPDIAVEDDLTVSEVRREDTVLSNTEETDQSGTAKHVSPSTPPNSPGIYLASTSQHKYLVDIDFEPEPMYPPIESIQSDSGLCSLQKEIDLNQIELHITTKLAMAENENNMNIEYSGPLTVEGLVSEDEAILRESEAAPEMLLAGNGGSVDDHSEPVTLDEECVKALRNELELKLPLAQVSCIDPAVEGFSEGEEAEPVWAGPGAGAGLGLGVAVSAPAPAPELVLSYAAAPALSPIAEETRHQLSAYENDQWGASTRTDSSESYPEPCNDSTAEVTELPTAASTHSTYTIHSRERDNNTYTVHKDVPSSKDPTMSADSLNGSPYKKPNDNSPIDDRTYSKNDDEKASNCERISQISPFLMSPTTETSAPESVVTTGVSTLSKTTVPTDAKHSKPSECLSKATSIDSWCSNDTLYNVEENFDDLMDADITFENERELVKSASTATLTHVEDKELSHCSTYIVHDSRDISDRSEKFSPDSITANDNCTYTKAKTEVPTTPSIPTEVNDSTKDTTKDLAYGTLPTYSNCTTEVVTSMDDPWKIQQPELVRRSPVTGDVTFTPPRVVEEKEITQEESPKTTTEPVKRMDSVEITCLHDDMNSNKSESSDSQILVDLGAGSYNDMAPSRFSTPLVEVNTDDNVQPISMTLPTESPESNSLPNFTSFVQSAEIRPQDITCVEVTDYLLEGESKTITRESNRDSFMDQRTPTSSEFENSAAMRAQEVHSRDPSSQSIESSGEFRNFQNSAQACPQDLSTLIDTNSLFLNSERKSSEVSSHLAIDPSQRQSAQAVDTTNLNESHIPNITFSVFVTDLDEDENEQPHSIIITEIPVDDNEINETNETIEAKIEIQEPEESPDKTFNSHERIDPYGTFNSHTGISPIVEVTDNDSSNGDNEPEMNGVNEIEEAQTVVDKSPKTGYVNIEANDVATEIPNGKSEHLAEVSGNDNDNGQNYAIVNFINETFEELMESNVDDKEVKETNDTPNVAIEIETPEAKTEEKPGEEASEKPVNGVEDKVVVTKELISKWIENEKKFCTDSYLPLLSDIRFTGPASEIMSTSFNQESPTEPTSPECEQDKDVVADIVKDWDSDSESQSSNSSSGEFIWKDGDGHETAVVPSTHFDHQQGGGAESAAAEGAGSEGGAASGDSGSGSEGDEVEFVPSSWDCRAAPSKSSLRSLEQTSTESKKRVVFKRQKYHCVYEYPRDAPAPAPAPLDSPHTHLPDLSTYCEWDPSSAEEAELGYGQLYGSPLNMYQLRSGITFGSDYDEDFFISSSARPFESLGILSTTSQFFPGMHIKPQILDRDLDDVTEEFPPPPSPLTTAITQTRAPSLDFTTPDSGVEDITPGSTSTDVGDEDFKAKKLPESDVPPCWKPVDSGSSSESVSPSSPGGEALGGLRHTRDKLKLDLPPSPHIPSPRHNRVFNFVLDKPKRHRNANSIPDDRPEAGTTPLVMTDETPIISTSLPIQKDDEDSAPEPTFSTFGKCKNQADPEQKIILTDEDQESPNEVKEEVKVPLSPKAEGTVVDSGDEDSGIESSSKATLERKTNVS